MGAPSIRGVGVQGSWSQVNDLIVQEMISREELTLRLDAEALVIVESKVEPSDWYPVAAAESIAAVATEFLAGGDLVHLLELGRRGFDRLIQRSSFSHVVDGVGPDGTGIDRSLHELGAQLFDFGEWSVSIAPTGALRVAVDGAEPLGEILSWLVAGYVSGLLAHTMGIGCEPRVQTENAARLVILAHPAPQPTR